MSRREPIFNAPGAVIGLILLMAAVAGGMALLGEEDEIRALLTLAFIPARFSILGSELPGAPWATWTSFVTHIFVHGGVVHLVINCAWLLAFGGAVATRIGSARFLILTVLTGIAGAALFLAFNWGRAVPMVGASGAVSGLMGCAFRFFFSGLNRQSLGYPPEHPADLPRPLLPQDLHRPSPGIPAVDHKRQPPQAGQADHRPEAGFLVRHGGVFAEVVQPHPLGRAKRCVVGEGDYGRCQSRNNQQKNSSP